MLNIHPTTAESFQKEQELTINEEAQVVRIMNSIINQVTEELDMKLLQKFIELEAGEELPVIWEIE